MFSENNKKRGFILLIGVLVAMIILSVGVVMANIVFRELIISFTARESSKVFFVADTGIECARYWDNARSDTRYQTRFSEDFALRDFDIACDGVPLRVEHDPGTGTFFTWLGRADGGGDDPNTDYCVNIEVRHCTVGNPGCSFPGADNGVLKSTAQSWAFNFCDETKPRRVDRAIRAQYVGAI